MKTKKKITTLILFLLSITATACISIAPPAPTAIPSITPSITPLPLTPTATIDWFPATSTVIPTIATIAATPTPILEGDLILEDDFSQATFWDVASSPIATSSIENNRLTLSVNQPAQITSMRNQPVLTNFRLDVEVGAKICGAQGSYGILFRSTNSNNQYRLVIRCDKTVELERILNGNTNHIMEPVYNPLLPTNLSEKAKISIIADGTNIEVYINHLKMITLSDRYHTNGTIGFFAQTPDQIPMTANFSNLTIYELK